MPVDSVQRALEILRDGGQFQWYIIPIFSFVVYIYAAEIERKNWNLVFAGLAFWGMDWINEIVNSLVFHFTDFAPMWGAPANGTAYLILIGLNIEIMFMFAIAGIAFGKMLPEDKNLKLLGISNRIWIAVFGAAFGVLVEIWLNHIGALTWEYAWWDATSPLLIFLIGYLHFYLISFWVHDMEDVRNKMRVVGTIWGIVIASLIVFGGILGWI